MNKTIWHYVVPAREESFAFGMPKGAEIIDVVTDANPFSTIHNIVVLVDPQENKGEVVHFSLVPPFVTFDPQGQRYLGRVDGGYLWVSEQRTPY